MHSLQGKNRIAFTGGLFSYKSVEGLIRYRRIIGYLILFLKKQNQMYNNPHVWLIF